MPPTRISDGVLSWASDLDTVTVQQAARSARLPIVAGHVALMPDAHLGIGATVGSVIPTEGAIIPAAVGVDIGCGMIAVETDLVSTELPDDLTKMLSGFERSVPAGVGKGHAGGRSRGGDWLDGHRPRSSLSVDQQRRALEQFGTLGSGNHFLELSLDERGHVWLVLHSGSRGIGNQLAQRHIDIARGYMKKLGQTLEDRDLAYLVQGTPEFDTYIADLLWAQAYAMENRAEMLRSALVVVAKHTRPFAQKRVVNCHHNYAALEDHGGRSLWITRKGAIRAGAGEFGVIPGSMGTSSFIVHGLGNAESWESSSHGAGRRMSRGEAKRRFTANDLTARMGGRTWLRGSAKQLVDEIPDAYKDIDQVMADQRDLVKIEHELRQVLNYKGTN